MKPFGTDPVKEGDRYAFIGDKFSVVIEYARSPEASFGNVNAAKSFVDSQPGMPKTASSTERMVSGVNGIFFTVQENGGIMMGWAAALNGAVVAVKTSATDPSDANATELFEKTLASFAITNPDFFKDSGGTPSVETPEATPDDLPGSNKPAMFENDLLRIAIPRDWESTSQSQDTIEITPAIDNAVDANQGISINIMDRHKMASDLAYAKSLVASAKMEKHGKNDFASFSIASQGIYVFIASSRDKTIMFTVSTPGESLTPKHLEFLGTVEIK
jgi:hypothetical protein